MELKKVFSVIPLKIRTAKPNQISLSRLSGTPGATCFFLSIFYTFELSGLRFQQPFTAAGNKKN